MRVFSEDPTFPSNLHTESRHFDRFGVAVHEIDSRRSKTIARNAHHGSDHAFSSPISLNLGRRTLCYRIMGRRCESTTLCIRLAYIWPWRPAAVPPSKSLGSPAPQTSLSTSFQINSSDRVLMIRSIPFSQFSSSQTRTSLPFSFTSVQSRSPPVTMHGFTFNVRFMVTSYSGRIFCDR